ncbi:hypothetical protein GCM10008959_30040 [Deinococcus seoulensis]|uniref:Uncharacterized protein n=2 Tax=Deinococcus seoulensis TaxID=1837379 RepID=A0ABQ2RTL7_9DEIO|nr:hypothetical protein GCM10008959_30040 [Deinococcus seoulensis]
MPGRKPKPPITINRGREQIRRLTALRTERRDARQYAQQWYAALHTWDVHHPDVLPNISYAPFRDQGAFDPLTMGDGGPPRKSYLRTPAGEISEAEVGRLITDMTTSRVPETVQLGRMLDRLRRHDHGCMQSLLRGGSWSSNREGAVRYAVAVLTLAVRVGDVQAERPLKHVQAELAGLPVVVSV